MYHENLTNKVTIENIDHLSGDRFSSMTVNSSGISKGILFTLTITFVFLILFSIAVTEGLSHDEYQFISSGQLLAERGLLPYLNYPFLHMPYIVAINALLAKLSTYDFLAIRVFNAITGTISAIILIYLARRILEKSNPALIYFSGFLSCLFLITDQISILIYGRALNHALPILLSLVAYTFYYEGSRGNHLSLFYFLSGLVSGLATGIRLSYAVLIPAFAFAIFLFPFEQSLRSRTRNVLKFGTGIFIASIPILIFYLLAPNQFYYGNYIYTRLNTIYREILGFTDAMTLSSKFGLFSIAVLSKPANFLLYSITFLLLLIGLLKIMRSKDQSYFQAVFVGVLSLVLLMTAFTPTPAWPQYFIAPLPFLIISFLYGLAKIEKKWPSFSWVLIGTALISIFTSGGIGSVGKAISETKNLEKWKPLQLHQFASEIQKFVPEGKVLTLAPIIPLEVGLETYEIFAVGPFSWRTAHLVGESARKELSIISYHELDEYLETQPPEAILVGVEQYYDGFRPNDTGGLEKPFTEYAVRNGYKPVNMYAQFADLNLILWIKE